MCIKNVKEKKIICLYRTQNKNHILGKFTYFRGIRNQDVFNKFFGQVTYTVYPVVKRNRSNL